MQVYYKILEAMLAIILSINNLAILGMISRTWHKNGHQDRILLNMLRHFIT